MIDANMNKKISYAELIKKKLTDALAPTLLDLTDDSHKHAGHSGYKGDQAETHFSLVVVSEKFKGLSKIARHRLVYRILAEELKGQVHALAIVALAPGENLSCPGN
jgi:BolA family transcriptional regulator, general stress-responsive regulator